MLSIWNDYYSYPILKKNKVKQMDIEYKPPFERIH